jgi:membrane protein required for colicin V production
MPPWVFDVVVVAVVVLSAIMSVGRGLIRETFSVIAFMIGGLSAYLCIKLFEPPLKNVISPGEPSIAPAVILFMVGFLVAYVIAAFLGSRLSRLFNDNPEIGWGDRLAGALLGVVKAVVVCVLFVVLLHQVVRPGEEPPEIAKSQTYPLLDTAAGWIGGGLTGVIELFTGSPATTTTAERTSQ